MTLFDPPTGADAVKAGIVGLVHADPLPTPTTGPGERGARCKSCKAPVRWAAHAATGKAAPIDAEPSADGNCHLWEERGRAHYAVLGTAAARDAARAAGTLLHTNHFQTCPHATDWQAKR